MVVGAHVAFTNDAALVRIFGNVVGAFKDAILAPNALVIEMADNAGAWVFFVIQNGATVQAGRIDAVMAGGCYRLLEPIFIGNSMK